MPVSVTSIVALHALKATSFSKCDRGSRIKLQLHCAPNAFQRRPHETHFRRLVGRASHGVVTVQRRTEFARRRLRNPGPYVLRLLLVERAYHVAGNMRVYTAGDSPCGCGLILSPNSLHSPLVGQRSRNFSDLRFSPYMYSRATVRTVPGRQGFVFNPSSSGRCSLAETCSPRGAEDAARSITACASCERGDIVAINPSLRRRGSLAMISRSGSDFSLLRFLRGGLLDCAAPLVGSGDVSDCFPRDWFALITRRWSPKRCSRLANTTDLP